MTTTLVELHQHRYGRYDIQAIFLFVSDISMFLDSEVFNLYTNKYESLLERWPIFSANLHFLPIVIIFNYYNNLRSRLDYFICIQHITYLVIYKFGLSML